MGDGEGWRSKGVGLWPSPRVTLTASRRRLQGIIFAVRQGRTTILPLTSMYGMLTWYQEVDILSVQE